jgi:hypothetical protein
MAQGTGVRPCGPGTDRVSTQYLTTDKSRVGESYRTTARTAYVKRVPEKMRHNRVALLRRAALRRFFCYFLDLPYARACVETLPS